MAYCYCDYTYSSTVNVVSMTYCIIAVVTHTLGLGPYGG